MKNKRYTNYSVALTNGMVQDRTVTRDDWRRNLITRISDGINNVTLSTIQYSYDELNRITSRNTDTFDYNDRSEVTAAFILTNAYTYAYDNIGNHTTSSVDSVTTTYSANNLNQYSQISGDINTTPLYDLDRNILTNGVWSYSYDAENRLIAAYSNSVCIVSNAYDYMSRRVAKWTASHTTTLVYDGWNLVQETIHNPQSAVTNQYVWCKDLSGTMQGAGGIGGLLAVKQDKEKQGTGV